jgi:hypothetical protein
MSDEPLFIYVRRNFVLQVPSGFSASWITTPIASLVLIFILYLLIDERRSQRTTSIRGRLAVVSEIWDKSGGYVEIFPARADYDRPLVRHLLNLHVSLFNSGKPTSIRDFTFKLIEDGKGYDGTIQTLQLKDEVIHEYIMHQGDWEPIAIKRQFKDLREAKGFPFEQYAGIDGYLTVRVDRVPGDEKNRQKRGIARGIELTVIDFDDDAHVVTLRLS